MARNRHPRLCTPNSLTPFHPRMLRLGGFSAWITIDGLVLATHNTEVSNDGKTVTCWIASEVGKAFAVHWRDDVASLTTCGDVRVDGKWVNGFLLGGGSREASVSQVPVSTTAARALVFSTTELTDDDDYLSHGNSPDLGTINLKIQLAAVGPIQSKAFSLQQIDSKVHERSKKLGTHSVALGELQTHYTPHSTRTVRLEILATFVFKYRPLDVLQAQGIVQLPLKPPKRKAPDVSPPDIKPNIDQLDDEADIDARLKALRAEMAALEDRKRRAKRVKREQEPVFLHGEVIDLT